MQFPRKHPRSPGSPLVNWAETAEAKEAISSVAGVVARVAQGFSAFDGGKVCGKTKCRIIMTGWWLRKKPSETYEFVNWDHDTQYMEK